jgi:phosphatidylglycerophosphate synthase
MLLHSEGRAAAGSYRDTVTALRAAQKPAGAGSPAYSRFVNRWLGRHLAALARVARLTPDQVTGLSALSTAGALASVAMGPVSPATAVLIGVLLILGYALDSADGQLARLTGSGRPAGEWLDHTVDAFKVTAVHGCVLIGWYRGLHRRDAVLLAPLGFMVLAGALFFLTWLMERLRREQLASAHLAQAGSGGTIRSLLLLPTDFGAVILLFLLWGWPTLFAVGYLALLACTAAFAALALPRWFREVSGFGRAT